MVLAPIRIGYGNHIPQSHAISLDHPNYLAPKFFHVGGNMNRTDSDQNEGTVIAVHTQPTDTYHTYVSTLDRNKIFPVTTYNPTGETATYDYVPVEYRLLVLGAVKLLIHIHSQDWALICERLELNNLQISNTQLKIIGVDFEHVDHRNKNVRFGDDWRHLRELLISHVFQQGYFERLPDDMIALLDRMNSYQRSSDERFMKNHLAIMSAGERIDFFKKVCDKEGVLYSMNKTRLHTTSLQRMGNNMAWTNGFGIPPNAPIFSAVSRCYDAGVRKGVNYNDSTSEKGNTSLIRCARNVATHLPEHLNLRSSNGRNRKAFGDIEMDIMLMATFGRAMTRFHRELSRNDLVKHLVINRD